MSDVQRRRPSPDEGGVASIKIQRSATPRFLIRYKDKDDLFRQFQEKLRELGVRNDDLTCPHFFNMGVTTPDELLVLATRVKDVKLMSKDVSGPSDRYPRARRSSSSSSSCSGGSSHGRRRRRHGPAYTDRFHQLPPSGPCSCFTDHLLPPCPCYGHGCPAVSYPTDHPRFRCRACCCCSGFGARRCCAF